MDDDDLVEAGQARVVEVAGQRLEGLVDARPAQVERRRHRPGALEAQLARVRGRVAARTPPVGPSPVAVARRVARAGTRSSTSTVTRIPPASRVARRPPRSSAAIRPSQPPLRLRARSPRCQERGTAGSAVARPVRASAGARGPPRHGPRPRRATGAVTVSRSRASRVERTSVRRSSTIRSASSRAARTASSRSRRARRRSSCAAWSASVGAELGGPRPVERIAGGPLGGLDRGQGRLERALRLGQPRAGVGDDGLGQPEPLGDREGLAAARQADRQAVGRRQRLEVELDGGVARPGRRVGVGLELRVVGRRRDQRAGPDEVVEQRLGERRALGRIRPGAELVEQDERPGSGRLDDPDDRAEVPGERRQRLGDRLLVTDVGEHVAPDRQPAARGRRDVQAGLVHQAQQAERPERDGLAAGVRAGHDQRRVAVAEADVDRHHAPGEARVAGRQEHHLGSFGRLRAGRLHLGGQRRLGGPEVEPGQRVERLASAPRALAATNADSSSRIRATSSASATCASRQAFPSSTATSGSMNRVWPLPEASWTMPLTRPGPRP